jgi:Kazal-type serine protease inhibitor domain
MRKLGRWMLIGVASVAVAAGMFALSGKAEAAGGCLCPKVYAPVTCSNGKTYTNSCVAKCNHGTDCVSVAWHTLQIPVAAKRSVVDEPPQDDGN